ncbi:hypothetical protein BH09BAC2_BH09BAC2_01750 [soil metagenome]
MNIHLNEYLIIIDPHEELRNRILQVKKQFADDYRQKYFSSKPHLTLVKFVAPAINEEKICHALHVVAMGLPPVKIDLKNYKSIPSHTIYINTESKLTIKSIVRELSAVKKLMRSPDDQKPHFKEDPFIAVAQRIESEVYDKAWLEYSNKHFTGHFIADKLLLLKRKESDKGPWQIAGVFQFQNLPVSVKQGDLF